MLPMKRANFTSPPTRIRTARPPFPMRRPSFHCALKWIFSADAQPENGAPLHFRVFCAYFTR